ncbi:MAG: hypothetical protein JO340_03460 [Acidobacteriaceae bacterium]|nr:hypothetical protein [Acidobacteriaceae bacterium]
MKPYPRYLDWLRYASAFLLLGYGSSKLAHLQFHLNEALAQRPVASLTGYELTWFYYGYSRAYACILGSTQVIGGMLLLFRKTALLGAVAMLPVIVNILLIDTFILPPDYGPSVPAFIIFASLVTILWRDRANLLQATLGTQIPEPGSHKTHFWIRAAIVTTILGMTTLGVLVGRR